MKPFAIKICGLTSLDDARAARDAGADFLGFVLFPGSGRAVTPAVMARIAGRLDQPPPLVGVFVNQPADEVARIAGDCNLSAVQLHGDEDWADYASLPQPVWRAFRLVQGAPRPDPANWPAARFVLDAAAGGSYGGTGCRADWAAGAQLARRWPLMLAGGLTPENVAAAVRQVRPLGVDVSGGVEKAPRCKDRRRLVAFVRAARAAARELENGNEC